MPVSRMQQGRGVLTGLAASTLFLTSVLATSALACSITVGDDKWANTQNLTETAAEEVERYQGLCGLVVPVDGTNRYVIDDNPTDEDLVLGRFWVFTGDLTIPSGGSVTIYRILNGTTPQLSLVLENNGGTLQLVGQARNGTGTSTTSPITLDSSAPPYLGWHVVKFVYDQGSGDGQVLLWVDNDIVPEFVSGVTDYTAPPFDDPSIERVANLNNTPITDAWLGAIARSGAPTGSMQFDSYETYRSGTIEDLVQCDATDDGLVNINDVVAVLDELGSGPFLAPGQPDCTGDGNIDINDAVRQLDLI